MSKEAMKLALEALEPFITPNWAGCGVDKANSAYDALREALAEQPAQQEPIAHCEAGPEYCPRCLIESKTTYGSEEVRKLREVIESQAKIISKMEREQGCPPFWPVVQHLLDEYGLQLIDVVAAYKQATEQPAQRKPLTDEEIEKVWRSVQANDFHDCVKPFARAIEAAHGIKENT